MADQRRTKSNTYFQRVNHIKLKKSEVTKTFILDAAVQRAAALGKTISDGLITEIITAIVSPTLGTLEVGDTVASGLSAGATDAANYVSTEGDIDTVVTTVTINGSAALLTDTVADRDVVEVSISVTDVEGNERVFDAGIVAVGLLTFDNSFATFDITTATFDEAA